MAAHTYDWEAAQREVAAAAALEDALPAYRFGELPAVGARSQIAAVSISRESKYTFSSARALVAWCKALLSFGVTESDHIS